MIEKETMLDQMKISTRLIAEEALRRGFDVKYFPGGHTKTGVMVVTHDGICHIVKSTVGGFTQGYGVFVATNKYMMSQLLTEFNIPTPKTLLYTTEVEALDFLQTYKKLVVKPIDTNHGVGVTTGIITEVALKTALDRANKAGKGRGILIQEMCEGIDYRLLVVGDTVVAAAYREAAQVVGDGVHTIAELLVDENSSPLRGKGHSKPLSMINTPVAEKYLHHQGKSLQDIPMKGEKMVLAGAANLSQGGSAVDVTDSVHSDIKAMAVRAAKIAGLGVCGVDVMSKDISLPSAQSLSYVIELNESPGIRMHHFPSIGKSRDVASAILDQVLQTKGLEL